MARAVDSDSPVDPAALVAAGVTAIGRYLHTLTRAEVDGYHAHGISVWLIWEMAAQAALDGSGQGSSDAAAAVTAARALGAPARAGIYFASDFDPGNPPAPAILDYYRATANVRQSGYRNGAYAGAGVLNECLDAGVADLAYGVGAYSWDHSQVCTRRVLQQLATQSVVGGVTVDDDNVLAADFGQWAPPAPPQPPKESDMQIVHVEGGSGDYVVGVPTDGTHPWAMAVTSGTDLTAWEALGAKDNGVTMTQTALTALAAG